MGFVNLPKGTCIGETNLCAMKQAKGKYVRTLDQLLGVSISKDVEFLESSMCKFPPVTHFRVAMAADEETTRMR